MMVVKGEAKGAWGGLLQLNAFLAGVPAATVLSNASYICCNSIRVYKRCE